MFQRILIGSALLAAAVSAVTYSTETDVETDLHYEALPGQPLNGYEFEMMDLLGLGERPQPMQRQPSLRTSASQFLLEVYNEMNEHEAADGNHQAGARQKRALRDNSFISRLDRMEIEKCNNIITFSSRVPQLTPAGSGMEAPLATGTLLNFNTNDVPKDLKLAHSALRIYQLPRAGHYAHRDGQNVTISIYRKVYNAQRQAREFRILTSLNSTTAYRGWLEFNMTRLLGKWLQHRSLQQATHGNNILVGVTLGAAEPAQIPPSDIGLIGAAASVSGSGSDELIDLQPFVIGYFNGPELMAKIQKLRFKRDVIKRKRKADYYRQQPAQRPPPPPIQEIYKLPKTCERLNFTLDFKDLQMHNWVIAPKKFEAYFCGGECNFPLGSKMNATNHAIVQTLMHLKKPNLPKPCCVPTVLGSISILHYINEDSVNLSKYPQSVAKECGCH